MMVFFESLFSSDLFAAMGHTLIHSLWQGSLIVLIINGHTRLAGKTSSSHRYNAAFAGLLLMFWTSCFTLLYYYLKVSGITGGVAYESADFASFIYSPIVGVSQIQAPNLNFELHALLPLLGAFWLIGVMIFSVRLIRGIVHTATIKRTLDFSVSLQILDRVSELSKEYNLTRPLQVAISKYVLAPTLIGFLKPIIIFPLAAINQLHPDEIEMILRHEIGHIRRNDYLQNIVIRIIEIMMFYHPCTWWLSHILQKERENHCDDQVLDAQVDRLAYAKTLLKLGSFNKQLNAATDISFSGSSATLLSRIKRILNQNQNLSIMKGNLIVFALLIAAVLGISATTYLYKSNKSVDVDGLNKQQLRVLPIGDPEIPEYMLTAQDTSKKDIEELQREKAELHREGAELHRERAEIQRKPQREQRESRQEMRELRQEMREKEREYRSENRYEKMSDEEKREFEKRMEELGEKIAERFESEEFEDRMEEMGERIANRFESEEFKTRMNEMEKRMNENFEDGEFEARMEEMGERLEATFDSEEFEESISAIAEWGAEFGANIARSVSESFDEDFQIEIDKAIDEIHVDGEFAEDMGHFGEEIGEMVAGIVDGVFEGMEDIHDSHSNVRSKKHSLTDKLAKRLKADGFYKDNKVALKLEKDKLKINGKSQPEETLLKYKHLLFKYSDVDNGKKFTFNYSDKNGKKKSSLTIED